MYHFENFPSGESSTTINTFFSPAGVPKGYTAASTSFISTLHPSIQEKAPDPPLRQNKHEHLLSITI